jgi:hypothetical protein
MSVLASQLLLWALVSIPAYLAWRHIHQPPQPNTWTLDDLVSKRPESDDETQWADEYANYVREGRQG